MNILRFRLVIPLICLSAGAGCVGRWRPPLPREQHVSSTTRPDFATYLRANRTGIRVYERTTLRGSSSESEMATYPREMTAERMREGTLTSIPLFPLEHYLQPPHAARTQPAEAALPASPVRGGFVVFFELSEPMPVMPIDLRMYTPVSTTSPVHYFDHMGRPIDSGSLKRVVELEGVETVDCPAGTFADCLRVRVDLTVRFRWGPIIDWTSYLWLSPHVGEVKHVQRISGWFWILWFGSAHEYLLTSYQPLATPAEMEPAPEWVRGVVQFDGLIPFPQIAGMAVDFAGPSAEIAESR